MGHRCLAIGVLAMVVVAIGWAWSLTPTDAIQGPKAIRLTDGGGCAIWDDQPTRCWGETPLSASTTERPFARVGPHADATDIAFSLAHDWQAVPSACVIDREDRIDCLPAEANRILPAGGFAIVTYPRLRSGRSLQHLRSLAIAGARICVIAQRGAERDAVWCHRRQPGDQDAVVVDDWTRLAIDDAVDIAVGTRDLCAVERSGRVRCLDLATGGVRTVEGLEDSVQVAVGHDFLCARDRRGIVRCLGNDDVGQLGDGGEISRDDPRPIALGPVTDLSAHGRRACALRGGVPFCWGAAGPDWSTSDDSFAATPEPVSGVSRLHSISVSNGFTCGIADDRTVRCWGFDAQGALGDGTSLEPPSCTSPRVAYDEPGGPSAVRTGDALAHPRTIVAASALVILIVLGPVAWIVLACVRALRRGSIARRSTRATMLFAGALLAFLAPAAIVRLASALLLVSRHDFAFASWADAPLFFGPIIALAVTLDLFARLRATVGFPDVASRAAAFGGLRLFLLAIPALLLGMLVTHADSGVASEVAVLLRDKYLDLSPLFYVRWLWTIAWMVAAGVFAIEAAIARAARSSH